MAAAPPAVRRALLRVHEHLRGLRYESAPDYGLVDAELVSALEEHTGARWDGEVGWPEDTEPLEDPVEAAQRQRLRRARSHSGAWASGSSSGGDEDGGEDGGGAVDAEAEREEAERRRREAAEEARRWGDKAVALCDRIRAEGGAVSELVAAALAEAVGMVAAVCDGEAAAGEGRAQMGRVHDRVAALVEEVDGEVGADADLVLQLALGVAEERVAGR